MKESAILSYTNELGVLGRKKTELQTKGVRVPEELMDEMEKNWNAPAIKRGRFVVLLEIPETMMYTTVLIINGTFTKKSPFHIVKNDAGKYEIWENDRKFTDIALMPRPKYYDFTTGDGVPMSDVAVIGEPDHLRSVLNQKCYYQEIGKSCKFCAIESWWAGFMDKTPAHVAEVAEAAFSEGMAKHVTLSTGTRNSRGKGLEDVVAAAKLIHAKTNLTMTLNFEPLKDYALLETLLREGKEAGATTALCNIECFDENLREDIMPMKGKNRIEDYVRVWEKCTEVFDHNEVYTMVIAGLGESDECILKGVEMAASMGVVASIVPHTPMMNAVYQDMEPPTVERMLYLYDASLPIYEKYGLRLYGGTGGIFTSLKGM